MQDGLRAFARGAFDEAVTHWSGAARLWERSGDKGPRARALSHLAQALQSLGQYREAIAALENAAAVARSGEDQHQLATILGGLGNACLLSGATDKATRYLAEALDLARELKDDSSAASVLNTIGILRASQGRRPEALEAYRESARLAALTGRHALEARALLNTARLLALMQRAGETRPLIDQAVQRLRALPSSHDTAFSLVSAGVLYADLGRSTPSAGETPAAADDPSLAAAAVLGEALRLADAMGNPRLASYALGHLGALYEDEGRADEALQLSRRAVFAAQQANAPESLYRWQWQVGRLLARQGQLDPAIESYRRAVQTLQAIRLELTSSSAPGGISFRESVGPVYLELVDLLLSRAARTGDPARADLAEARDNVELLKAAELRDYFRDDCVDAVQSRVTKVDVVSPTAAVVYPILLPDRLELLVTLPGGHLTRVKVPVSARRG